ncbi:Putative dehydrogenase (fragment) [Vibrio tapetis subsp. tapetis]|uniref:Dehydrogenase n=1 Tax=Vibrio tapetis subsp. tapetis TaxID=1671868 RepID=A0A2N8ZIA8_9VIBR
MLAKELAKERPARVNAISAGLTMTVANKSMDETNRNSMLANAASIFPAGKAREAS